MENGKRKLYFAGGVVGLLGTITFAGAIPGFAFLQAYVNEFVKSIVYVTVMFMAGNVGEHVAPYLPTLFGKKNA